MANSKLPIVNASQPTEITCGGCGVCCFHMGYPAFKEPYEQSYDREYWLSMPAELRQELITYIKSYQSPPRGELDGPCFWLDLETRRCKHHQHRPTVCRTFETGSSGCRQWRQAYADKILSIDQVEEV